MDSLENTWANNDKLIIHEIRHWEQNGPVDITSSDWHFTAVVWTLQALTQMVDVKLHHNSIKRFKSTHKTSFFCFISYVNIQFSCVGCDFMLEAAYIFSCISCELSVENNLIKWHFLMTNDIFNAKEMLKANSISTALRHSNRLKAD